MQEHRSSARLARQRAVSDEPYMTAKAVAERLATPLQTFYDWRKHGRGPIGYRVGGRVLYRWSEVEQWMQAQREVDTRPTPIRRRWPA